MRRDLAGAAFVLLISCGATDDQLRARAAFDMQCPKNALQLVEIDSQTRGVRGCGQRMTYVESCGFHQGLQKGDCTWVANTSSKASDRPQTKKQKRKRPEPEESDPEREDASNDE